MALNDSGMHAVVELAARVITRRVEDQAKRNPALACIDNPLIKSIGVMGVRLDASAGSTYLVIEGETQMGTEIGIVLTLAARGAEDESMRVVFEATYHKAVDGWDPDGGAMPSFDQAFRDSLENNGGLVLGAFDVVDLEPLLPKDHFVEGDIELALREDDTGTALALGIEVALAGSVERGTFRDVGWPSIRSGDDFALEIDGALVSKRIREDLSQRSLSPQWVQTGLVRTWWNGDDVLAGTAWGREAMVSEELEDNAFVGLIHGDWALEEDWEEDDDTEPATIPIWVLVAGSFGVGDEHLLVDTEILDAGWSYASVPAPDAPAPERLAERELEDGLVVDFIGHATGRFNLRGADLLEAQGQPFLLLPELFRVKDSLQRCYRPIDRGFVLEKPLGLRNTGGAPLFICGIELQSGAPQLSLPELSDLELPALVEAGEALWLPVRLEVNTFNTTYTGELVVRSNHLADVEQLVSIEGEKRDPEQVGIALELCVEPPQDIPPQEWFENLMVLIWKLDELVSPPLGAYDYLEVRVRGLSQETSLEAFGGTVRTSAERVMGLHHLPLSLGGERPSKISVGARRWLGDPHVGVSLSHFEQISVVKTRERVTAMAALGSALYVAVGDGVSVFDVSRPDRPKALTRLEVKSPVGLATDGERLWIDGARGTVSYDVSIPLEPKKPVRGRAPRAGVASLSSARLRDGSLARTSERGREFALRLGVLTPRKQRFDRDRALEILLARP